MMSATQPSETYRTADSHFGAAIQTSLSTTPASAPPQIDGQDDRGQRPGRTSTATGV